MIVAMKHKEIKDPTCSFRDAMLIADDGDDITFWHEQNKIIYEHVQGFSVNKGAQLLSAAYEEADKIWR